MMMADTEIDTSAAVMLTTNSKILVTVDEALQDVIVVSYTLESRLFQGVLLDSTKRFLPCRINENVLGQMKSPSERSEEDKLFFSIRQRFTYFEEKPINNFIHKKIKSKSQKMTVRLRPRQVLCSKCKSICNENSENVNSHMTRRKAAPVESSSSAQTSKPLCSGNRSNSVNGSPQKLCPSFIPKIPCKRLNKSEVLSTNCDINGEDKIEEDFWFKNEENKDEEDDKQMVLRKKRSVGSMEDLWDETVFEEGSKKAKTTPVIKISFGSQGEGTVLKIPPKVQEVSEEEKPEETTKSNKKAKKSKKEAKRKPDQDQKEDQSRKHKHKTKHKKKHKSERYEEELKEKCLKQNLSIHLKRISSTAYEKKSDSSEDESSRSSDEIPDFPSGNPIDGSDVLESYKTDNGTVLTAGDIVWGKIEGFPWWPGKVLNISASSDKNSSAHISWYGTPTPVSSMMPCDQLSPFLQSFEVRYNKKRKSTGYKEAIRLATTDASVNNPDVQVPEILSSNKPVEV